MDTANANSIGALTWGRVRRATGHSVWAMVDQGVVSFGNFFTNILLARGLAPGDYGVFALLYAVLLGLNSFHGSLITYPLSVRGAKSDREGVRRLLGASLLMTVLLAIPLGAIAAAAPYAAGRARLYLWVVASMLAWQTQETCRRALLAHLRNRAAVAGDAISYLGQAACIFLLLRAGINSLEAVFAGIVVTSLAGALVHAARVGLCQPEIRHALVSASAYWTLGRLVLTGSVFGILSAQAVPWVLGYFHGTTIVASYQAAANLLAATHPVIFSVGTLIVPATAKASLKGAGAARRAMLTYGIPGGALLLPYFVVLAIWPTFVLQIFYGEASPYVHLVTPVRLFVVAYVATYLSVVVTSYLNGVERTRPFLAVQVAGAVVAIAVGYPLIATLGLVGAIVTVAAASTARAAIAARVWISTPTRHYPLVEPEPL